LKELPLGLNSAAAPLDPRAAADHCAIAPVDYLQRIGLHGLKDLRQTRDVVTHTIVAAIGHALGFCNPRLKLHIRFADGYQGLGVQPTHRLIRAFDGVQVLLRHRTVSISCRRGKVASDETAAAFPRETGLARLVRSDSDGA
jgi:hypothetical protein